MRCSARLQTRLSRGTAFSETYVFCIFWLCFYVVRVYGEFMNPWHKTLVSRRAGVVVFMQPKSGSCATVRDQWRCLAEKQPKLRTMSAPSPRTKRAIDPDGSGRTPSRLRRQLSTLPPTSGCQLSPRGPCPDMARPAPERHPLLHWGMALALFAGAVPGRRRVRRLSPIDAVLLLCMPAGLDVRSLHRQQPVVEPCQTFS